MGRTPGDDPKQDPKTNPDPQGGDDAGSGEAPTSGEGDDAGEGGSDDGEPEGDDDSPPKGDKTFTQAELDAIVNTRIAKAKKAERKRALEEAEAKRKRESMDETERLKAEKEEAERKAQEAERRVRESRIREQLAGKVVNVDDAVRVLGDDFVDEDTLEVDVDGFLKSRPYFRAESTARKDEADPGSPPATKRLTREKIANMTEKEIEERWDEVQAVLGGS